MTLLKGTPGKTYSVMNENEDLTETAEADENGVLRDDKGRAYSAGAWEKVG